MAGISMKYPLLHKKVFPVLLNRKATSLFRSYDLLFSLVFLNYNPRFFFESMKLTQDVSTNNSAAIPSDSSEWAYYCSAIGSWAHLADWISAHFSLSVKRNLLCLYDSSSPATSVARTLGLVRKWWYFLSPHVMPKEVTIDCPKKRENVPAMLFRPWYQ